MNQIKNIQYTCVEGKDQIAKFCIVPFEEVPIEIRKYLISTDNNGEAFSSDSEFFNENKEKFSFFSLIRVLFSSLFSIENN